MSDKRTVLVVGMGTSPAVMTETVWALAHQTEAVIKRVRPFYIMSCKPKVTKETLLDGTVETHIEECPGCSKKGNRQHFGTYCKIMDWNTGEPVEFRAIAENGGGHGK